MAERSKDPNVGDPHSGYVEQEAADVWQTTGRQRQINRAVYAQFSVSIQKIWAAARPCAAKRTRVQIGFPNRRPRDDMTKKATNDPS